MGAFMISDALGSIGLVSAAFFLLLLYVACLSIYRLYISPISKFPGPKITALTSWYEIYYDFYLGGKYTIKIRDLHDQYGPIVRINPYELHIKDPEYHGVLYSTNAHLDKLKSWESRFDVTTSIQSTTEHSIHRLRRTPLNPFFSKRAVATFTPEIQDHADKLINRVQREYAGNGKILSLTEAYHAFSTDNVMDYCFASNVDALDEEDFVGPFTRAVKSLAESVHVTTHFRWILSLLLSLPETGAKLLMPTMIPVFDFKRRIRDQILRIKSGENDAYKSATHPTIFNELLNSDLPAEELSILRLQHEAVGIVGAGIETVGSAMSIATFHILSNPPVHKRLKEELFAVFPDPSKPPPFTELEKLPYFTAVIRETLRFAYGVAQRLPRVNPNGGFQYKDYSIPNGIAISMDSYHMHTDESIYPSSSTFDPSRWLNDAKGPDGIKPLTTYLLAFSKGTRRCVGMNFAFAEMYIVLANVFRRLDLELFETERDAVDIYSEYFIPRPKPGTKGVRVTVKA